jgi:hypothetical protein
LAIAITLALPGVAACTTEPEILDVTGLWNYSDSAISTFNGVATCMSHGALRLSNGDGGLAGRLERTGECTDGHGAHLYNEADWLDVDGGQVSGRSLWFTTGSKQTPALCHYTATFSGPPDRIDGSLTCGQDSYRVGTWTAAR